MANKKSSLKNTSPAAYCIPGGLFIGLGLGMLFGNTGAGTVIGMGAGFVAWAILERMKK